VKDAAGKAATGKAASKALQAGDRAPDAEGLRRAHVGFPLRLFDVLRGTEHVLIVYVGKQPKRYAGALVPDVASATIANALLRVVVIASPGSATPGAVPIAVLLLYDARGSFARAYGAKAGMTWLIRPDGYIGLRARKPDLTTVRRYFRRIIPRPHT
jgi:hypothetical protein